VDRGLAAEDVPEVGGPESHPQSEIRTVEAIHGRGRVGVASHPSRFRSVFDGDGAAALGLAAVLAGAAVVAALAAAQPLAGVLALAVVLVRRKRAAALALAAVLPGAAVVPGLAAAHALAGVHALAGMVVDFLLRTAAAARQHDRAPGQPRGRGRNELPELPTIHRLLHRSSMWGTPGIRMRARTGSLKEYLQNESRKSKTENRRMPNRDSILRRGRDPPLRRADPRAGGPGFRFLVFDFRFSSYAQCPYTQIQPRGCFSQWPATQWVWWAGRTTQTP